VGALLKLSWLTAKKLSSSFLDGSVFAYPTEAVYGLGCNPWHSEAVEKIYDLKQRPRHKGLILCAAHISQFEPFLQALSAEQLDHLGHYWPGPHTFVVPLPEDHPWPWLALGEKPSIALRVSAHPVVQSICSLVGPVVSTSANPAGLPPARRSWQVRRYFGESVSCVVSGSLGVLTQPTQITDLVSGKVLRS